MGPGTETRAQTYPVLHLSVGLNFGGWECMQLRFHAWTVGLVVGLLLVAGSVPVTAPDAPSPQAAASPVSTADPSSHLSNLTSSFHPTLSHIPASPGLIRHPLVAGASAVPTSQASDTPPAVAAPTSPVLRASWTGLGSSDNGYLTPYPGVAPPDVQMAVGPNHVVEMVNLAVSMWTKQGVFLQNKSLMAFFGTPTGEFISDPKVQYDAASGRWFASLTDVATSTNVATGQVLLAVSSSSDPTGTWKVYKVPSVATGECLDQPILGVGSSTVTLSVNVFSSCLSGGFTYNGAQYWVLSKADLVALAGAPATQSFGPFAGTASFHPAQTIGASATDYMVSANAFQASVSSIEIFRLTGVPPAASVAMSNLSVRAIASPPPATQPGGGASLPLDTGDFRVMDAAWSAGSFWVTLSDGCTPTGDTQARSCVRLIEVNTTTNTVAQDFDVSSAGTYYLYPALRADARGNLLVVFGYSSATAFPGLMAAGRVFGDPLGTLDPPTVVVAGGGPETLGCSKTAKSCRYGDYFGAGLDPSNGSIVWAAGEFATSSGWSTRIFAGSVKAVMTMDYRIVNGGTGYELPKLGYTLDGISRSTALNAAPTAYAVDPGTAWSVSVILFNPNVIVNPTFEAWILNTSAGNPPFSGRVNASFAASFAYHHMYWFHFGFALSDNASAGTPMVEVVAWGVHVWAPADSSYYVDAGSSFRYPAFLNESTSHDRWILSGPANGTVTGPSSVAGLYYHQYLVSFHYVLSSAALAPAPYVAYDSLGTNASVQANATVWADAARAYAYQASLTGAGGYVRIGVGPGATGNVTAAATITVTYRLQYFLHLAVQPALLADRVTGGGWYDAGSLATLTASTPAGWKFIGYSGDLSSAVATATLPMTAPANVTALFYPGLTIVAGDGGSVTYSYGSTTGTVPAGSTVTVYAPSGSTVILTAQPSSFTGAFVSWGGAANGTATSTSVTLGAPLTVSAAFGTNGLLVGGIAAAVVAVILAALLLVLASRRRKKEPPA